jgi:Cu+-exporting ATPase
MKTLDLHIEGMDCADCTQHVKQAIACLPGVESVDVLLSTERASVRYDPNRLQLPEIQRAVTSAGYSASVESHTASRSNASFDRRIAVLLAAVVGTVLLVVGGEWLGLIETISDRVPWWIGFSIVLAGGFPIFRDVLQAAFRRRVTSHTLMTLGVIAALAVGQWITAAVVVMFMHVGAYVESYTAGRVRSAVKDLASLSPQIARVEHNGAEQLVPIAELNAGDIVVVRPGEAIPVDGEVIAGHATVNQAAITGEAMPVDKSTGDDVFAATMATLGSLRVRARQVGADTTFGRIVRLVEEAEAHRADVQRFADRFSAYYLPVVVTIAALTRLIRRDPLAIAAVLVVACSCSSRLLRHK